jgi:hypothetical protein
MNVGSIRAPATLCPALIDLKGIFALFVEMVGRGRFRLSLRSLSA